jgi:hypothetical protein
LPPFVSADIQKIWIIDGVSPSPSAEAADLPEGGSNV